MRIVLIMLLLGLSTSFNISAQQTVVDPLIEDYQLALEQYKSSSYAMAYQSFSSLENSLEDAHSMLAINTYYYKCRSAMQLFHSDAEFLMQEFLADYPNSTLYYEASRNLADYYYQKRAYAKAIEYYQLIDIAQLRKKFRTIYKFQYAYSLFSVGEMKAAATFFHDLLSNDNIYQDQTKYYFGYIA